MMNTLKSLGGVAMISLLAACSAPNPQSGHETPPDSTTSEASLERTTPMAEVFGKLPNDILQLNDEQKQALTQGERVGTDLLYRTLEVEEPTYWKIVNGGEGDYGFLELKVWEMEGDRQLVGLHWVSEQMGDPDPYTVTQRVAFVEQVNGEWQEKNEAVLGKATQMALQSVPDLALDFAAVRDGFAVTNTGQLFHWDGVKFITQAEGVTRTEGEWLEDTPLFRNVLQSPAYTQADLIAWEQAFAEGTPITGEAVADWLPTSSTDFLEEWYGYLLNEEPTVSLRPQAMQAYGPDRVYWFDMDYQGEAATGTLHVVRLLRGGRWHSEMYYTSATYGALPAREEAETELGRDAITVVYRTISTLPHLLMFDDAFNNIDMGYKNTNERTYQLTVNDSGLFLASAGPRRTKGEFIPNVELKETLAAEGSAASEIAKVRANEYASKEHKERLIWELQKVEADVLGTDLMLPQTEDIPAKVEALVAQRKVDISSEVQATEKWTKDGWVAYEINEMQGEHTVTYTLIFNTPLPLQVHGDGLDDVARYMEAQDWQHVSLLEGTLEEVADLNQDGRPDYKLTGESHFRTTTSAFEYLLWRNAYGELVKSRLAATSDYDTGTCVDLVGTDQTLQVAPEGGTVQRVTQASRVENAPCEGYDLIETVERYQWDEETQRLEKAG